MSTPDFNPQQSGLLTGIRQSCRHLKKRDHVKRSFRLLQTTGELFPNRNTILARETARMFPNIHESLPVFLPSLCGQACSFYHKNQWADKHIYHTHTHTHTSRVPDLSKLKVNPLSVPGVYGFIIKCTYKCSYKPIKIWYYFGNGAFNILHLSKIAQ